jgi:hypothetical protein
MRGGSRAARKKPSTCSRASSSEQTWRVGQGGAKLLQITSPAGFEQFAAELGEPAASPTLPAPAAPDIPRLLAVATKYHKRMA